MLLCDYIVMRLHIEGSYSSALNKTVEELHRSLTLTDSIRLKCMLVNEPGKVCIPELLAGGLGGSNYNFIKELTE